ncbi:MAG: DUF2505 family protein [Spirochaetota bacterium]
MKYTVTHTFEYPLEKLLKAREDRYKHLDKFPDLKNITLLEEREEGEKIFQKRKISLAGSLPPVMATLLEEAALVEESYFYTATNTHEFKLFPPGNEKVVTIKGVSTYKSTSETTSERHYEVEVKSSVFLVSGLIEAAIEEIHKNSLKKDKNSIIKFIQEIETSS